MNLYLFNANDSAATYGIGTYLKELTNALKGTDIRMHIVHLHASRPEFGIEIKDQVEHWHVPDVCNKSTISGALHLLEKYCRNVIYLLRLHIKDTKDLVFHFNYNQSYALAKGLKEVFECQTVCTVHFMRWALEFQGNLSRFQSIKAKPENQRTEYEQLLIDTDEYESMQYKAADKVVALSRFTKEILISGYQLNAEKISFVPNGMEDVLIENVWDTDKIALRSKWNISEKEYVILFVGRLHPAKGIKFLIEAFHHVLATIPNCRLIIAGSGKQEPYLQATKSIGTKITFTGLIEKQALHELYRIADIGVLPSLTEQCSYVLIEMMMHGLPLVVTATSGLNEMVNQTCGLKIPVMAHADRIEIDTETLAEKIIYLLQHPDEAKTMGQNGRKRYLQEYTSEVFRENMLNLYRSLYASNT